MTVKLRRSNLTLLLDIFPFLSTLSQEYFRTNAVLLTANRLISNYCFRADPNVGFDGGLNSAIRVLAIDILVALAAINDPNTSLVASTNPSSLQSQSRPPEYLTLGLRT